jgi:hypothetical protein
VNVRELKLIKPAVKKIKNEKNLVANEEIAIRVMKTAQSKNRLLYSK